MNGLNTFLDTLYKEQLGFVYVPTKNPDTGAWAQKFFIWPKEKPEIIDYIQKNHRKLEVYIAPALYKVPKISYDTFQGTYHVWCEFDGELPNRLGDIPEPSLKIQSSTQGHEHWYWQLTGFETDSTRVAEISKRLAYTLGADLSGWDATQVLRPPGTVHHKSHKIVSVISEGNTSYDLASFETLAEAPIGKLPDINVRDLPNIEMILLTYKFKWDTADLLQKPFIPVGSRSSCLTRLAFDCHELGMKNEEILSVLYNADERWKKFSNREDQLKRLQGIINHVYSKKATETELEITHDVFSFYLRDFLAVDVKLSWMIDKLLPVAGKGVIYGAPGCGKSTFCLRMGIAVASQSQFFDWNIPEPQKVLFVSCEMGHMELKDFLLTMNIPLEQQMVLQKNLMLLPIGYTWPLETLDNQARLFEIVDNNEIKLVIFDSLQTSMAGDVNSNQDINRINDLLNKELCKDRGTAYWFIHHPRKPQGDNRPQENLFDMYGSMYIAQNAQTVLSMRQMADKERIKLEFQKQRHTNSSDPMYLKRLEDLSFEVITKKEATDGGRIKDVPPTVS